MQGRRDAQVEELMERMVVASTHGKEIDYDKVFYIIDAINTGYVVSICGCFSRSLARGVRDISAVADLILARFDDANSGNLGILYIDVWFFLGSIFLAHSVADRNFVEELRVDLRCFWQTRLFR